MVLLLLKVNFFFLERWRPRQ